MDHERTRRLVELEAVNALSSALRSAKCLDELLPCMLQETLKLMQIPAGAIYLYDPQRNELHLRAAQDWFSRLENQSLKPGEDIGGRVFAKDEIYWIIDYTLDEHAGNWMRDQVAPGWGGVCVPIKIPEEIFGVIFLAVQRPRNLTADEVRLICSLTEIAGNAIQRMRLHAQTERCVQRLNALHNIDTAMISSRDLREILDVILEQVIRQLGAHASDILLLNEQTQRLETLVAQGSPLLQTCLGIGEGYAGRVALEQRILTTTIPDKQLSEIARPFLSNDIVFKTYYGAPLIAKGRVKGVLELFFRNYFTPDNEWLDFLEALANQSAIAIDSAQLLDYLQRMNRDLVMAYDMTIEGWSHALELRDRDTEGHTRRVADMTLRLACVLQDFSEEHLVHLRWGALLHDIGKIGVPDEILLKPGPLNDDEWKIMRKHAEYGYDLLYPIEYLQPALNIPYSHHERWDGKGYPQGLRGEQIPLEARIFSVVDVWDALTSDRPYRKAWKPEAAKEYIQVQSGVQFDPPVVSAFLDLLEAEKF